MSGAAKRNEPLDDGFQVHEASRTSSAASPETDECPAAVGQNMDEGNSKEDKTAWRDL